MNYKEMLRFIFKERARIDKAVDRILRSNGGRGLQPNTPAANPADLKKQGGLFKRQ